MPRKPKKTAATSSPPVAISENTMLRRLLKERFKRDGICINVHSIKVMAETLIEVGAEREAAFALVEEILGECLVEIVTEVQDVHFRGGH